MTTPTPRQAPLFTPDGPDDPPTPQPGTPRAEGQRRRGRAGDDPPGPPAGPPDLFTGFADAGLPIAGGQGGSTAAQMRMVEQAAALGWSRGHADTMAMAAARRLHQDPGGGFWCRSPGGGRPVAAGRVHALIGAGLLEISDDGGRRLVALTEDGRRALEAWCRHRPDPVAMTARQEADPLPYLLHGDEHRRRWAEHQRLMAESQERVRAAMERHAARLEQAALEERRNAEWRRAHGIRNPFAKPPAGGPGED